MNNSLLIMKFLLFSNNLLDVKLPFKWLLALSCLLLCSCMSNSVLNVDRVSFDEVANAEPDVDDISFVVLKSSGDNIISDVSQLKYRNHRFYVFDRQQGIVVVYNENGDVLGHVKSLGHGHGEYVMPLSFDVDAEGNVFVADASSGNIYEYSSPDFNFKQQIDVGVRFLGLGVINDHEFWITSYYRSKTLDGKLAYYNAATKEFKNVCKPIVKGESSITYNVNWGVYRSDSLLYYYERFSPFFYRVKEKGVCSDTVMIESSFLPEKRDIKDWMNSSANRRQSDKIVDANAFYIENDNIYISLDYNMITNLWYSASRDAFIKFKSVSDRRIWNLNTMVSTVTDSHYVSMVDIDRLKDIKKEKLSSFEQEILQSVEEQGDDSSIVLLLYRLK